MHIYVNFRRFAQRLRSCIPSLTFAARSRNTFVVLLRNDCMLFEFGWKTERVSRRTITSNIETRQLKMHDGLSVCRVYDPKNFRIFRFSWAWGVGMCIGIKQLFTFIHMRNTASKCVEPSSRSKQDRELWFQQNGAQRGEMGQKTLGLL